jgi:hypothetical protein
MNDMREVKVLNDHIKMLSASGHGKAVPIWQIKQWVKMGRFRLDTKKGNSIGYDFVDHAAGVKDYEAYLAWEAEQAAKLQQSAYVPRPADAGIAEAALKPREAQAPAFTPPPNDLEVPPTPAADHAKHAKRPRPQDVI